MLICLNGPWCSGKSTVARLLHKHLHFVVLQYDPSFAIDSSEYEEGCAESELSGEGRSVDGCGQVPTLVFQNPMSLSAYTTKRWQQHFVIVGMNRLDEVFKIRKRPIFWLLTVDAPTMLRYERLQKRDEEHQSMSLEQFIRTDDAKRFSADARNLARRSKMSIQNSGDVLTLLSSIADLKPLHGEHVRPSWDTYFLGVAYLCSLRSSCMKSRVGAVLVKDHRIISTGYNGTPKGCTNCHDGGCQRCNSGMPGGTGLDVCFCLHAEENAIIEAGRDRAMGSVVYCTLFPCVACAKKIVHAGVREVVFGTEYAMDDLAMQLFHSTKVEVRMHKLVPHHLGLFDAGLLEERPVPSSTVSPNPRSPAMSPARRISSAGL